MEAPYGDMGNSIREKHKARRGDFVMFADDDNWCATIRSNGSVPSDCRLKPVRNRGAFYVSAEHTGLQSGVSVVQDP